MWARGGELMGAQTKTGTRSLEALLGVLIGCCCWEGARPPPSHSEVYEPSTEAGLELDLEPECCFPGSPEALLAHRNGTWGFSKRRIETSPSNKLTNFYIFYRSRAMRKLKKRYRLLSSIGVGSAGVLCQGGCILYHKAHLDNLSLSKHSRQALEKEGKTFIL